MDVCSMSYVGRKEVWKCLAAEAGEVVEAAESWHKRFAVYGLETSRVISQQWTAAAACW